MSEALERFKATHPDIDDGTPTMSLPRAKERSASSDTTPTQPTPLKRTRGVSDPRSSGSASDEELHSNLAEAGPQLPQPGRKSEKDHSAHCPAPNASSAVETETAPRIASLDGAVETGGTQPKSSVLVNDDDELGDINALIASLEADDKEDPPTSATTDKETEEPSPVPDDWLRTDINVGLTTHEAAARRHACGYNEMNEEKKHILKKWLAYFRGPIQYTMILIAILAAALQHWVDLTVIFALIILNTVVAGWQEGHASSVVNALNKTMETTSRVLRDGRFQDLNRRLIVPGDILKVEEGSIVPADGRIVLEDTHLQVDQSAITGESLAKTMHHGDTCFASSLVRRGKTLLIVTAIGDNTRMGRTANMITAAGDSPGHFRQVLNGMTQSILVLVFMTLFVVWTLGYYRSKRMIRLLEYTIIISITGVPVGLPTVVTTTLTVGSAYLAKRQAVVKNLNAIEALAGVEVLCTDKTGTLTKNKLTMGTPYTVKDVSPDKLMLVACLAASHTKKGMEPIDLAFLKALKAYPTARETIGKCKIIEFTPFDPVSKKVTAVCDVPEAGHFVRMTCVKGAPLTILKLVMRSRRLPFKVEQEYEDEVDELASRGFRSIGVAARTGDDPWELLGIMPCTDPPRHDTAFTIREAKALGLRVKMLTGDAIGIAREMSRQLAIGPNIYEADKLAMAASARTEFIEAADGFAEVFPEHKHLVVDTLQRQGYLVAMTGDGVNDAPSLKKADTGIAVQGASDAAIAAADIVFRAPGLSAIIDAIKISRQIFHRIHAYIVYRIALTVHLQLFFGLWMGTLDGTMSMDLVVFIAIFADIATLAMAYDNALFAKTPSKWNLPKLWGTAVILGFVLAAGTWLCYGTMQMKGLNMFGIIQGYGELDAVLYLEIILTQNWLIFVTRTRGAFWSDRPALLLLGAILIVDLAASAFCLFGWFQPFRTSALTIVRVWIFSFFIFGILATIYWALQDNPRFDAYVRGHRRRSGRKERMIMEFVESMKRMATVYAQWDHEAKLEQARQDTRARSEEYGYGRSERRSTRRSTRSSRQRRSSGGPGPRLGVDIPQSDGLADVVVGVGSSAQGQGGVWGG